MKIEKLKDEINNIWKRKEKSKKIKTKKDINTIMETIKSIDKGKIRVTEKKVGNGY